MWKEGVVIQSRNHIFYCCNSVKIWGLYLHIIKISYVVLTQVSMRGNVPFYCTFFLLKWTLWDWFKMWLFSFEGWIPRAQNYQNFKFHKDVDIASHHITSHHLPCAICCLIHFPISLFPPYLFSHLFTMHFNYLIMHCLVIPFYWSPINPPVHSSFDLQYWS